MLTYFMIGAAIGAITGVPIGPANVAVIDAAYRHNLLRAIAVGFGAAIADGLYALLGILGVGPILDRHPGVPPILYGASGVVLVVYGILTIRSQPVRAAAEGATTIERTGGQRAAAGFGLGLALVVLNPAAIVTWVVIVGSFMKGVTNMQGIAAVIGISCGSFAWFSFVAYLADHGKKLLGDKAIWITRIVGILLVGYGLFSLFRAAHYLFTEVW
jgi:threonine/homoserine/homoserine lactone efflux protein